MKVLITANKGGVGCSSIAYLISLLLPNRVLYSNDPWHVPDYNIIRLWHTEQFTDLELDEDANHIFDISLLRDKPMTEAVAKQADVILIPCINDLTSAAAALDAYKDLSAFCKKCIIVMNGYRFVKYREETLSYLYNNLIAPEHIIQLQDSRLMPRLLSYGPEWQTTVHDGKGMYRLTRTIEKFEDVLTGVLQ